MKKYFLMFLGCLMDALTISLISLWIMGEVKVSLISFSFLTFFAVSGSMIGIKLRKMLGR